ncbi:hypothetical protein [Paractinoplanes rishiriensis]|uniref:Uncharacterized protein n=1 Tax=Paractinoplanes rishiriensis TaxID=1050105 RepID=A0A919JRQ2_9ACTN|nr:hypothetical protein [Actinoplanes rishiriensis]GIE93538.1 hypothetical protein Ari01nite_10030 [Actinoplanes rishiriensis]
MAGSRLYVARDDKVTAVSRGRLRMSGATVVRRDWNALVELTAPVLDPKPRHSLSDTALVVLPPVLAGSLTAAFAPVEAAIAVGGAVFFAASYLSPVLRRRFDRAGPRTRRADVFLLTGESERQSFQQAVAVADRVSETWPALGALIDANEAEDMLAEALWEIAGALSRRQELTGVLTELSRPDFAAVPAADQTARELTAQLHATRAALSQVGADLARREASLRRTELAGRNFIREQDMRRAIRAAEDSLRAAPPPGLSAEPVDAAAELAEHTQSVLAAYRELTAGLHLNPPLR